MHKEIGKCYWCGEFVYASEGQAVKWIIKRDKQGNAVEQNPTHKKCRKRNK